ncbi:carboxylate--amine ligase [Demequina sp. NBRC 110055]|uniref:carboxylate--amine ligase n=1 Tax=Demequina sp. NBRC 110055 TaxID=1570344 RepID=UPI001F2FDE66|nr:carboxylate--amine ligase [Demequina sp. NBRC 110055]
MASVASAPYAHEIEGRTLVPVILGGDIGGYSLARAFHEAYGIRSILMSTTLNGVVRDSDIVINEVHPDMDDPDACVAAMLSIAAKHPGADLIAIASADWLVRTLVEHRAELEPTYVIPYVGVELLDLVTSKHGFEDLCREYGLAHPHTVVADLADGVHVDTGDLRFPVIAKAGSTAAYHHVEFAGKEKVHTVDTPEALTDLLTRVRDAGYRDTFIIQDLIPGDDSALRITNTYVDRAGRARRTVFGHVLLQEHTPSTLGNSSVVLTTTDDATVAGLERMLEGIGWVGAGSFDMKVDPRTGEVVLFELNPRLSRSNYYVTGSGFNPAVAYVRDWVLGADAVVASDPATREHVFTVVPRALMRRYLIDADVKAAVARARKAGAVSNPLWNRAERQPRRWAYVAAHQLNQIKKYRTWYPRSRQQAEREQAVTAAR